MYPLQDLKQSNQFPDQPEQIAAAARIIREGGTVAFPTETVYGLGADATNPAAIRKIYEIKQRPCDHPLIVHIASVSDLAHWVEAVPAAAYDLANHFWPGPLTLILQRSHRIADCITGGQSTVGLRVPAHPTALALLEALGPEKALAAPSANRFGRISPTSATHVHQELGSSVDMILDGGSCEVGLESTIVSFHAHEPLILRPGKITPAELENVLGRSIAVSTRSTIRSSGSLPSHYAPSTPLGLFPATELWQKAIALSAQNFRVLVLTWSDTGRPQAANRSIEQFGMPADPIQYGKQLYATLHRFDQASFDYFLVETPPNHVQWLAISDRLQRASFHFTGDQGEKL